MPKVSVIIPSYNHAAYIAQAIQSVLTQSLSDLELIVIDDGSRDNTVQILEKIQDSRLHVVTQENQGAHAALNRGLEMATGCYCAILNSDDRYHPQRLEKLVNILERDKTIGLVASYLEIINAQGRSLGIKHGYKDLEPWPLPTSSFRAYDDLRAVLLTENYLATTSNYVFRREWHQTMGGFRPLRYTHDWDFALRIARQARIELVPEALLQYRIHSSNTIRENQVAMIFEICWCLAIHLPQHLADPQWFKQVSQATRVDQLLRSLYTYGNDVVLSVLLLQNLHLDDERALLLLDPQNETRQRFIDAIKEKMALPPTYSQKYPVVKARQMFLRLKRILMEWQFTD